MSKWQFVKSGVPTTDPLFDDGEQTSPGDEGFNTTAVEAAIPAGADGFNYVGISADDNVD
jgi:hypothetical protein